MPAPNQTVLNAFVDGESLKGDGTPGNPVHVGSEISVTTLNATTVNAVVVNAVTDVNVGQHLNVTNDVNVGGAVDITGGLLARSGILLGSTVTDPYILKGTVSPNGAVVGGRGSLYLRTVAGNVELWQNTDGNNAWSLVGGGGLFGPVLSAVPSQASTGLTTWWYANNATVADGTMGVLVKNNNPAGVHWPARSRPVPGATYTIKALVATGYNINGQAPFFGWSNGAVGGPAEVFYWVIGNAAIAKMAMLRLNSPTSVNLDSVSSFVFQVPFLWIRLRDDGTNVSIAFSMTGDDDAFATFFTVAKAGGFLGAAGYTHVVFGASNQGMGQILSWTEGP